MTFSRTCHDHEPTVRRRVLCWHRHGSRAQVPERRWSSGVLEPAELHIGHFRAVRPAAACGHWQAGGGEAVRPRRPDVRRVPGPAMQRQVRSVLLRERHMPPGEFQNENGRLFLVLRVVFLLFTVLLRAMLGHHPFEAGSRVPQAIGQGGSRSSPRRSFPLVLIANRWAQCSLNGSVEMNI